MSYIAHKIFCDKIKKHRKDADFLDAVQVGQVGGQVLDVIARYVQMQQGCEYVDTVVTQRQQMITSQLQSHQFTDTPALISHTVCCCK